MSRDTTLLHPELQQIIAEFLKQCEAAELPVLITQTWRTKAEQDALYAQGRTAPGSVVTNAKYPQSPHCWGVAFDFCQNIKGREWDDSDGFFAKVGAIGKSLGLAWGGDWKSFSDKPHLEFAKYLPNNSVKTLQSKYSTPEKFKATWKSITPEPSKDDEEMVDKTKILYNGMPVEVERILKNDTNYIKLRDLEKFGLSISWDSVKKIAIVTN